ncbi:MAG: hypothetical protein HY898_35085 [Deltaproteobacteria bacterium]|nr:hypothetical protein [Deltaproteobacteria bacterium]
MSPDRIVFFSRRIDDAHSRLVGTGLLSKVAAFFRAEGNGRFADALERCPLDRVPAVVDVGGGEVEIEEVDGGAWVAAAPMSAGGAA